MTGARLLAALAFGLALTGCGAHVAKPDPAPSAAMLAAMRTAPFPVYWLGSNERRAVLTSTQLGPDYGVVKYGEPACTATTCYYAIVVTTLTPWDDHDLPPLGTAPGPVCFSHVGPAVLMGCAHDNQVTLFTGHTLVVLDLAQPDYSAPTVAGLLRPLSRSTPPLQAPAQRVSCTGLSAVDADVVANLPHSLRPVGCQ